MRNPEDEKQIPYHTFTMNVQYTLLKNGVKVETDDYEPMVEDVCYDDTTNTDWKQAYESEHYTIAELLKELETYIDKELGMVFRGSMRHRELLRMRHDLQGWEVEEEHFEEG